MQDVADDSSCDPCWLRTCMRTPASATYFGVGIVQTGALALRHRPLMLRNLETYMLNTARFAAAILVLMTVNAHAQTTCQYVGTQRICNDAKGNSSTTQRVGNQEITNYNNGQSATSQQIGNQMIKNYSNGASATSQQIGNQTITNYSNGTSATTQQIGNTTVTNFSDGRSISCQTVGTQRICN